MKRFLLYCWAVPGDKCAPYFHSVIHAYSPLSEMSGSHRAGAGASSGCADWISLTAAPFSQDPASTATCGSFLGGPLAMLVAVSQGTTAGQTESFC